MRYEELKDLLERIRQVRIGVVGDFCLDVYLLLDPGASEPSLETGLSTRPVRSQRYSLGAAGNVSSNLRAMGVPDVFVFGVIGEDPFGHEMRQLFDSMAIDCKGLLTQREEWDTHVYMKPFEREQEQHRFDFGSFDQLLPAVLQALLKKVEQALPDLDVIIFNQQVRHGIHTRQFREEISNLVQAHPEKKFIVDSRHYSDEYSGTIRKINAAEAAKHFGKDPAGLESTTLKELCRELYKRWGQPLFLTRGEQGCIVCDNQGIKEVPGLLIVSPVDPVGAGDSMLAGIAAALAAGADTLKAAEFGSLVAGVTVQKLMQTGTASRDEILKIGADPDRRYRTDLARQRNKAVYYNDSEIEVVSDLPHRKRFTHAIFDHDGTLSTLRQGWEAIMEPMMVRAILGPSERNPDEALHNHVVAAVRDFIDKTTGIQTLVQMKGLIHLVRRFKCVPESEILDESAYKNIYNRELLEFVGRRIAKLQRGELSVEDLSIRKSVEMLSELHQRGVLLYLASGTDREDVLKESQLLGIAKFFDNRIYGAVGDIAKEAKRMVLERILTEIGDEAPDRLVTFGDGPVEIRETHKRGGYTVGVASDEIRRYGLNQAKRERLIEAGADLIIPDYSQQAMVLTLLFGD